MLVCRRSTLFSRSLLLFGLALALSANTAQASPVWSLDLAEGRWLNGFNIPRFSLSNESTAGERITAFEFHVGDEDFFIDFIPDGWPWASAVDVATEGETGATLTVGDRINDQSGVAAIAWSFDDFDPGESLVFGVDVDPWVGLPWLVNTRTVFFNNGPADNAWLLVGFSDGSASSFVLPDGDADLTGFNFSGGSGGPTASPIPEPKTLLLLTLGLIGLAAPGRTGAAASYSSPSAGRSSGREPASLPVRKHAQRAFDRVRTKQNSGRSNWGEASMRYLAGALCLWLWLAAAHASFGGSGHLGARVPARRAAGRRRNLQLRPRDSRLDLSGGL